MLSRAIALMLLILLCAPDAASARPTTREILSRYQREGTEFGILYSRGGVISGRPDRVEYVTRSLRKVEASFGRGLERHVTLVLVPSFAELSSLVVALIDREPNPSILGMAFPSKRWAIVREDDRHMGTAPWETPVVTLEHELAHLVIHDRGGDIPRWFDEGASMWVSQRVLPPDAEAELGAHARFGGLFRLSHLTSRFPTEHLPGSLAYRQSFLMVQFLVERHGEFVVHELLDGFDAGESFEPVYARIEGSAADSAEGVRREFEEDFRRWLVARNSLFTSLVAFVNFWTLIALLAIVAIVAESFRRGGARRRLAEQDELDGLAGDDDAGDERGPGEAAPGHA